MQRKSINLSCTTLSTFHIENKLKHTNKRKKGYEIIGKKSVHRSQN